MSYPGNFGTPNPNPWPPAGDFGQAYGAVPGIPATPPPPKSRKGVVVILIGVGAVVLLVVIALVAAYFLWPRPEQPVKQSALSDVLLTKDEAGKILGVGPLVGDPEYGDDVFDAMNDKQPDVVDEACVIGSPDDPDAHGGSGWTDIRVQYLQVPAKDANADGALDVTYTQSVVAFPDSDAAAGYVASTKTKWEGCADRTVNQREKDAPDDPDDLWKNGAVTEHDGTVIWPISHDGEDWSCMDLMAARANLVIEVEQCGTSGKTDSAEALVSKIGEKIDQAPRD